MFQFVLIRFYFDTVLEVRVMIAFGLLIGVLLVFGVLILLYKRELRKQLVFELRSEGALLGDKMLYNQLLNTLETQDFLIYDDYRLKEDLKLTPLEIKKVLSEISFKKKNLAPKAEEIESYEKEKGKINTVKDLSKFIHRREDQYLVAS